MQYKFVAKVRKIFADTVSLRIEASTKAEALEIAEQALRTYPHVELDDARQLISIYVDDRFLEDSETIDLRTEKEAKKR